MKLYETVAPVLRALGVDTVFGLMGDGNLRLVAHLANEGGLNFYASRHEGAAICMARGYAHATGRLGVASVTEGPGVTNSLTALVEAVRARQPVLLLAGDTSTTARRHNQDINQRAVLESLGIAVEPVRSPQTFVDDLARAVHRAVRDTTAVAVSVPTDWQSVEIDPPPAAFAVPSASAPAPSREAVAEVVKMIRESRRPLILVGRGCADPAGRPIVAELAARIGALLTASMQAKGAFTGDPFDLGISGGMASDLAAELIGTADLVLVLGASLMHATTREGTIFDRGARLVHCDTDPRAIGELQHVDRGVVADATEFARALLEQLKSERVAMTGFRTAELRSRLRAWRPEFPDEGTATTVDPRHLTLALDRLIPAERTVVQDGGHFCGWGPMLLAVPDCRGFDFGQSYMSVGLGIGAAVGAAVGRPDRRTVLLAGDGGAMMSLGDYETVSRLRLPMLVVVFNDAAYGAEVGILEALDMSTKQAYFEDVDLAAVGEKLGFRGRTIRSLDDLGKAAGEIADPQSRLLLDCKINPSVRGDWFKRTYGRRVALPA